MHVISMYVQVDIAYRVSCEIVGFWGNELMEGRKSPVKTQQFKQTDSYFAIHPNFNKASVYTR